MGSKNATSSKKTPPHATWRIGAKAYVMLGSIVGWALTSMTSQAGFTNGDELLRECQNQSSYCAGFLVAVTDLFSKSIGASQPDFAVCMPEGTTLLEVRDAVIAELELHPEDRDTAPALAVAAALKNAWPCG